jgi:hypothetical protein
MQNTREETIIYDPEEDLISAKIHDATFQILDTIGDKGFDVDEVSQIIRNCVTDCINQGDKE